MKPTPFPEANSTLRGGPASNYATADVVPDLPVHKDGRQIISCWTPTWRERLRVLLGGKVWLLVLARETHAPVCVTAEKPFQRRNVDG